MHGNISNLTSVKFMDVKLSTKKFCLDKKHYVVFTHYAVGNKLSLKEQLVVQFCYDNNVIIHCATTLHRCQSCLLLFFSSGRATGGICYPRTDRCATNVQKTPNENHFRNLEPTISHEMFQSISFLTQAATHC